MLEKSTFLSRIWTCRERERKEEMVFIKDKMRRPQESPEGGGQVSHIIIAAIYTDAPELIRFTSAAI